MTFNPPALYDLYTTQKMVTARMDTYAAATDADELSRISAMKRILKMDDDEIDQNFKNLVKEKQYVSLADYFSELVGEDHKPLDYTSPLRLDGIDGQHIQKTQENAEKPQENEEKPAETEQNEPNEPNEEEGEEKRPFGLG